MSADIKDWSANDLENLMLDDINLSREQGGEVAKLMGAIKRKFDNVDVAIAGVAGAYTYKGTVSTVADLPATGNNVGDVYNVTTGDAQGNYAWDGAEWDKTGDSLVDVDGAQVLATGTTTPRTLGMRFGEIINVRDFGAVGDGTADDWSAVNAALAAASGKGRIVFFPAGTYKISRMITIPSRCAMIGEAKGRAVIKRGYDYWQDSVGNDHTAMAQMVPDTSGFIDNVLLHNIVFDAQGAEYPNIGLDILVCSNLAVVRGLEISHCQFLDNVGAHAIDLQRTSFAHIHHCDFLGWQYLSADGATYREAIQFDIYGSDDDANRDNNVIIEYCRFGPSANLEGYYAAIGNHGYDDNDAQINFNHVVIRNNYFTSRTMPKSLGCAQIAIYVFDNVLIEGNHFDGCNPIRIAQRVSTANSSYNGNKNITICNNHMDGSVGDEQNTRFAGAIYVYGVGPDSTTDQTREAAATNNVCVYENIIENFDSFLKIHSGHGLKYLKFIDNHIKNCGGSSLNNLNIGFSIKNNTIENSGAIYTNGSFSDATTPKDFFAGYNISSNIFVDPPINSRCVHITNGAKGVIVKDNIVIDRRTDRTSGAYILFNSGVLGGILADNIVFASTSLTSYVSATTDSNTTCVQSGNQIYLNNTPVV